MNINMKVALINGSPKSKQSSSEAILKDLQACLSKDIEIANYSFKKSSLTKEEIETLFDFDILVFAFPLYVDGVPSHLLSCLCQIEEEAKNIKDKSITVYALVNCGFYEGHQNKWAINIMKNWCVKAGFKWGQGIGIGCGGALAAMSSIPLGKGPKSSMGIIFKSLADNIHTESQTDDVLFSLNFPRFMYKLMAELGWRQTIKKNGLKVRDLSRKL